MQFQQAIDFLSKTFNTHKSLEDQFSTLKQNINRIKNENYSDIDVESMEVLEKIQSTNVSLETTSTNKIIIVVGDFNLFCKLIQTSSEHGALLFGYTYTRNNETKSIVTDFVNFTKQGNVIDENNKTQDLKIFHIHFVKECFVLKVSGALEKLFQDITKNLTKNDNRFFANCDLS